jgi:hypothetical protein
MTGFIYQKSLFRKKIENFENNSLITHFLRALIILKVTYMAVECIRTQKCIEIFVGDLL